MPFLEEVCFPNWSNGNENRKERKFIVALLYFSTCTDKRGTRRIINEKQPTTANIASCFSDILCNLPHAA